MWERREPESQMSNLGPIATIYTSSLLCEGVLARPSGPGSLSRTRRLAGAGWCNYDTSELTVPCPSPVVALGVFVGITKLGLFGGVLFPQE